DFQLLYALALSGSDTFATLPQLAAQGALLLAVYGIARRLGAARAPALFSALLTGTLSAVALQAVYTKNDLAVASLLVCAAYFLLVPERLAPWWAGLAVGLALGTKLTAFYALVPLVLIALAAQKSRRQLATFALAGALSFAVVGSLGYALNIADSGKPLGNHEQIPPPPVDRTVSGSISSAARITYDFVDFSGYGLPATLREAGGDMGRAVFDVLRIPANPPESTARPFTFEPNTRADIYDNTYFGPLGVLLVLPVTAWILVAWARRRTDRVHGALALALPLFILAIALSYPYNQSIGRFLIAPAALSLALAAPLYRRRSVAAATAGIAAVTVLFVHLNDIYKPVGLFGRPAVWSLPRADAQALYNDSQRALVESVKGGSPAGPLGVVLNRADWSYPLFGDSLDREVAYLPTEDALERAAALGLRRVVLRQPRADRLDTSGWTVTALREPWVLASR
ncbi:MAG: glycosyltransferase 87 family protein, partial [Gaiellaceae bacterium]